MAAALAERRFLAEVEHPNIVKIFNFVKHEQLRLHRHGVRRRLEPEGAPQRAPAAPVPHRPGDRLHARDPPGARAPAPHRAAVLRLQARQRHPDAALAEADRPRRRLPDRRRLQPDLRHRRLPGAGDRARRARRSRPTSTPSRARSRSCASTSRATSARFSSRLPPPDAVPVFRRFDSLLPLPAQGHGRRPRRPLPVGRRDGRAALRRPARGRRAPRTGRRSPRRARSSPATSARAPTGRTGAALPALRVATRRSGRRLSRDAPGDRRGRRRSSSSRAAPEQTVEVELRLARELIDAATRTGALECSPRSRRRTRGSGARSGCAASPCSHRAGRGPRPPASRPSTARCRASWRRSSRSASALEAAGQPEVAAPWYEIVARTDPSVHDGVASGSPAAARPAAIAPARWRPTTRVPATSRGYDDAQRARIALPARRRPGARRRARRGRRARGADARRRAADPLDRAGAARRARAPRRGPASRPGDDAARRRR